MTEAFRFFDNPELAPKRAFYSVMGLLRSRFAEVSRLQQEVPGYFHWLLDRHPDAADPLATFVLADNYERTRQRKGEVFDVSLPIRTPSTVDPKLKEPGSSDYFVLTYWEREGGTKVSLIVDEATFEEKFINSGNPPVLDFEQKLLTYQVIPARKPI